MTEIINPYIAGSPIKATEMFFGREDVFEFVQQTLIGQHQNNVIVLYGQRRTGKTSILYQMQARLDPHYLCVFVDLHGLALEGINGFLWELTNHIYRILKRDHHLDLPRPDRTEFQADPRNFFENKFLSQIWSASGDRHLLLMVDEAIQLQERVAAGKLEAGIFEYLSHLMSHHGRLNFLFSLGSGLEVMEQEYAFLFRVGLYKKISFLDLEAAIALITQPAKEYYQVETAAVGRILSITSRHAYYTQLLCHCLFSHWLQHQQPVITVQEVNAILDEVVELGLAVLKYSWEESTDGEKAVLAGMATAMGNANRSVTETAIQRAWHHLIPEYERIIPEEVFANATRNLISRDVIVGQNDYLFTVDLLRLWIQKYERLEWVKEEIGAPWPVPPAPPSRRKILMAMAAGLAGISIISGTGLLAWSRLRLPGKSLLIYEEHHGNPISGVAWSPDGRYIASSDQNGEIKIWDPRNGNTLISSLDDRHIAGQSTCCWSRDGKRFASGDEVVQIWDMPSGHKLLIYQGHTGGVRAVAWSPDGKQIASGGDDGTVQVWDTVSGNRIWISSGHTNGINGIDWSLDGKQIVFGGYEGIIKSIDVFSHRIRTYQGNVDSSVSAVTWSPDGRYIASAFSDGTIQLYSVNNNKAIKIYTNPNRVNTVRWSPTDGRYIASGGDDRTVRVWEMASKEDQRTLSHDSSVTALAWSLDGKQVVSGTYDGSIHVWQILLDNNNIFI